MPSVSLTAFLLLLLYIDSSSGFSTAKGRLCGRSCHGTPPDSDANNVGTRKNSRLSVSSVVDLVVNNGAEDEDDVATIVPTLVFEAQRYRKRSEIKDEVLLATVAELKALKDRLSELEHAAKYFKGLSEKRAFQAAVWKERCAQQQQKELHVHELSVKRRRGRPRKERQAMKASVSAADLELAAEADDSVTAASRATRSSLASRRKRNTPMTQMQFRSHAEELKERLWFIN